MNKRLKLALLGLVVIALVFVVVPFASVTLWKSSTIDKTNTAVDAIDKTGVAVKDFNAKTDTTPADFDNLIIVYKNEKSALEAAKDQAESVGGFKGFDLTGNYKKATDTSEKLVGIYDELLSFNSGEITSAEAEKLVATSLKQSGDGSASSITNQAQSLRTANVAYQKYLNYGKASEFEVKFSGVLTKLADALERSGQAISSGNLSQLNNADGQLQAVLKELDALEPLRTAHSAVREQKLHATIDKLSKANKELETTVLDF